MFIFRHCTISFIQIFPPTLSYCIMISGERYWAYSRHQKKESARLGRNEFQHRSSVMFDSVNVYCSEEQIHPGWENLHEFSIDVTVSARSLGIIIIIIIISSNRSSYSDSVLLLVRAQLFQILSISTNIFVFFLF